MTDSGAAAGLAEAAADVGWPDPTSEAAARSAVAPSCGRLAELAEWVAGVQETFPPHEFGRARLVVFAAEHGIDEAGVSVRSRAECAAAVQLLAAGGGSLAALAELAGVSVRIGDLGAAAASGRIDRTDALSASETQRLIEVGIALADDEIDSGADLLIPGCVGAGATTAAATLIAVLTATEPVKVTGRGSGVDDAGWMRKTTAIRDARARAWPYRRDPERLLSVAGGADLAAVTGFVLRAAARRTPVLLDGVVVTAAALVAFETQPRCARWWLAGQRSPEPAHERALAKIGLTPILDLGVTSEDGSGALLALPLVRAAIRCVPGAGDSALEVGAAEVSEHAAARTAASRPAPPSVGLAHRRRPGLRPRRPPQG